MHGRIADLSLRAIRMAAGFPTSDRRAIARRLYLYGSIPRGPRFDLDFGLGDESLAVLDLTPGSATRVRLAQDYAASSHPGWFGFGRLGSKPGSDLVFKLYISPRPEALAAAFPILAAEFADGEVRSFKVGRGALGLLRPDKIVAYFDDRAHLQTVAGALARRLIGCPAQGAPFTAGIGDTGLLSWAIDPPTQPHQPTESWRSWITLRLADAILAVRETNLDPAGPVVAWLSARGVYNWVPSRCVAWTDP
jgi:hypothetical protein